MAWWLLAAIVLVFVAAQAWVRLAPSDPARWHVDPEVTHDADLRNGVRRIVPAGDDTLARLDGIVMDTPRTTRLAGSVASGRITYVTRSRFWGFPDYTTVARDGDRLEIFARARFGRSDMGVNRARVERWLARLGQS